MNKRTSEASVAEGARKPKFPRVQEYGLHIFNEEKEYRDNSAFLEHLFEQSAALFLRPMQLGKTSLSSLAELIFSRAKKAPTFLNWRPLEKAQNSWFVLRFDFGACSGLSNPSSWQEDAEAYDQSVL